MRTAVNRAGEPSSLMTRSRCTRFPMVCPFQSHSSRMKYAQIRTSVTMSVSPPNMARFAWLYAPAHVRITFAVNAMTVAGSTESSRSTFASLFT